MSSRDIRFHVTHLNGIKENKLQRALDLRMHGALIHMYSVSPQASMRMRKQIRVGCLAVPEQLVSNNEVLAEAVKNPNKKYTLCVGPYDIVITLYKERVSKETKLKKENDELRGRLEALERSLQDLQSEKKAADALLEHVLDSRPPSALRNEGGSRQPQGPSKRRPNLSMKRNPKRSPPHKRVKVPEKKDTYDGSDRLSALEAEVEHFNQIHLQKEMEYKAKVAQFELRVQQDSQEMASMMQCEGWG